MEFNADNKWKSYLADEFHKNYMNQLLEYLREEINSNRILFPHTSKIFRAYELSNFDLTKVVILGQDPYHGVGQAHGLSFSIPDGIALPPSLKNIYKEIKADLSIDPLSSGNLERWAKQGVLLLNSVLTVRKDEPGSHRNKGWEKFTDRSIQVLSEHKENMVFMLWGNFAKEKMNLIDTSKHLVLTAAHPSPLSAYNGFFGSKHFSKANEYLRIKGLTTIDWK